MNAFVAISARVFSFANVLVLASVLQVARAQVNVLSPGRFDPVSVSLDDAARAQRGELPFYGRLLDLNAHTAERWLMEHGGWSARVAGSDHFSRRAGHRVVL
jgi:hypothetical protein